MTELADIDRQLDELGPVPEDLGELLARYGEDDRSGQHLDSLLSSLGQGVEEPAVAALGVESVPAPAAPPPEPSAGGGGGVEAAAPAEPAVVAPAASDFAVPRDTDVDRPAAPLEAEPAADEMDDDFQAAPEVDALFDAPAAAAPAQQQLEEDDVEMSFEDGAEAEAELEAATDGLFDTLEDAEPVSSAPEADGDLGDPELMEDPDTAQSPAPDTEARKSDLKALLREEMDPSDFPQTPSSAPPAPPAAASDGVAANDDDDDFELLVDEDDIEEIEIDDDELELLED
jgi:hypothetical protein